MKYIPSHTPKSNVVGIEGVYVNDVEDNDEQGGQTDNFTEALQKLYRNRQKKVVSCVNGCLTRYDAVFHSPIFEEKGVIGIFAQ